MHRVRITGKTIENAASFLIIYPELKLMSAITMEEGFELATILKYRFPEHKEDHRSEILQYLDMEEPVCFWEEKDDNADITAAMLSHAYEFLRSKGYATPFMGYSVAELRQLYMIQIKEDGTTSKMPQVRSYS